MLERVRTARALQRCTQLGADVQVTGPLVVQNPGTMRIGRGVALASTPATSHLVTGPAGTLTIGDRVSIGHGFAIAAHESITIEDDAVLGPFVMLMDTDFHEAGRHDAAGDTGAIHIGRGARLGARVTVLRGTRIGAGAVVRAGSVVKGDVPDGAIVAGNPARPVRAEGTVGSTREIEMDAVRTVVAHTFGLAELPATDATRDEIPQWDSLGMLNLLLSLEETFDVSIGNEAMLRVHRVSDLVPMLEAAA